VRQVRNWTARAHGPVGNLVLAEPAEYDGGELVVEDTGLRTPP
jgi:predicted 2-oxoglutarate/Fe(II)-dependent dioxygenase YbiX